MAINPKLRQDIAIFLTQFHFFDDKNSRKATLLHAGLDVILGNIELSGSPSEFVLMLLDRLDHYGLLDNQESALIHLLQEIATQLGYDKQQILHNFCIQIARSQIDNQQGIGEKQKTIQLRRSPRMLSQEEVDSILKLNDNGRPLEFIPHAYHERSDIVHDHITGLIWQKSGSANPLVYVEAQEYIQRLNYSGFAGHQNWRIPTIEELASLIEEKHPTTLSFINPIFDARQLWCWSADQSRQTAFWLVDFSMGSVFWNYGHDDNYVRAVCS